MVSLALLAVWCLSFYSQLVQSRFILREPTKAIAIMKGNSSIMGRINFTQVSSKHEKYLLIKGDLENLDKSALRGLHVHEFGDMTNGCASAGLHFNPYNKTHGAPTDREHHAGDLGNIQTDADGRAQFELRIKSLSLNGPLSVLGRAIVVHAGTDDLGRGGQNDSKTVGHSGGRPACGVISVAGP